MPLAIIFYRNKVELEIFVALIGKSSNVPVLTVFANILFLLSSKSHKCQKHDEQEFMKIADKHRYCKNLPNISGRFRVTLDHVWPLRYITLSHPCVTYLYCFCIVRSHTYTQLHNWFPREIIRSNVLVECVRYGQQCKGTAVAFRAYICSTSHIHVFSCPSFTTLHMRTFQLPEYQKGWVPTIGWTVNLTLKGCITLLQY